MKKGVLTLLFMLFFFSAGYGEEVNRIIAKVNNEVITSKDLQEYIEVLSYRLSENSDVLPPASEEFKKETLARLIEDKLILDKAKKEEIEIPVSSIEKRFDEIVSASSSLEEFEVSLKEKGLTVSLLKQRIREQYLSRELINKSVRTQVNVSPQEISNYYQSRLEEFHLPEIYVLWTAKSEDKDLIKEVALRVEKKGVEETAKEYPELLVRIESPAKELMDEIAVPLKEIREKSYILREIKGSFYFIFLEKLMPEKDIPLIEVKEKIYSTLLDKKFREKFKTWVESLKKEAVIEIYP